MNFIMIPKLSWALYFSWFTFILSSGHNNKFSLHYIWAQIIWCMLKKLHSSCNISRTLNCYFIICYLFLKKKWLLKCNICKKLLQAFIFLSNISFLMFNYLFFIIIVIQLQLSVFSPHPSSPTQQNPPPSPTSTLHLDFVHVSFIVVTVNPSPHCSLPTPLCLFLDCP